MVTTYEALATDVAHLKLLSWTAVVVDQRQRSRSAAGRSHGALAELGCPLRLVLNGGAMPRDSEEMVELLSFLRPDVQVGSWEEVVRVQCVCCCSHAALMLLSCLQHLVRVVFGCGGAVVKVAGAEPQ